MPKQEIRITNDITKTLAFNLEINIIELVASEMKIQNSQLVIQILLKPRVHTYNPPIQMSLTISYSIN